MSHLKSDKKKGRKNSGSGKGRSILMLIVAVLLVIVLGTFVLGMVKSPSRGACRNIISEFQTSCNRLDANGIVSCLKPSVANPLKAALFVGGVVTSQSSDEMLYSIVDALGGGLSSLTSSADMDMEGLFQVMSIEPKKYGFPARTRKVRCKATFGIFEQYINIYVSKSDGEAYISKIELAGN